MTTTLSPVRRAIFPRAEDTWETIAQREMHGIAPTEAVGLLQSWNMHVFMRPLPPAGSPRAGNPILPGDVIFVAPPAG
ncbi:MAG: hypothetical protein H6993_01415 [Pseudomonadales bacterium]|nr:hypothetical protein [Pseudomonadales bacterium]MCP5182584.1 hypothetical protein [Pseudomonadales bacterium]